MSTFPENPYECAICGFNAEEPDFFIMVQKPEETVVFCEDQFTCYCLDCYYLAAALCSG